MKTSNLLTLLVLAVLLLAGVSANGQFTKENLRYGDIALASKFAYQNLKLYPVYGNQKFKSATRDVGKYDNLKNAIAEKKVVVSETGAGTSDAYSGTVNTLMLENNSSDTVIILAGEVVKGGKQDRVLAEDVLLSPKSKTDISVFCVEHNRWSTQTGGGYNFGSISNVSTLSVRKTAVVDKNQQRVWKKVADFNSANKVETTTGTYTAMETDSAFQGKLKPYISFYKEAFRNEPDMIGFVAVTGDSVMGCDMFATHDLFKNSCDELIYSYATEAISNGKPVTISDSKVIAYVDNLLTQKPEEQENTIKSNGIMLKSKSQSKILHFSTY
jgi:hypothetical protein